MQIADGGTEVAELRCVLPHACRHVALVSRQVAHQRHHQHEGMLGYGIVTVMADVGDRDTLTATGLDIDMVVASGGDGQHLQLRQCRQRGGIERYLIGNDHVGVSTAGNDVVTITGGMRSETMGKAEIGQGSGQAVAIKKNNV